MTQTNAPSSRKATTPISLVSPAKKPPTRRKALRRGSTTLIEYAANQDPINTLFNRIVRVLKSAKTFFDRAGQLVRVQTGRGMLLMTSATLDGNLSSVLEISFQKVREGERVHTRFGLLPPHCVPAFLTSPSVVGQLPKLRHYARVPVYDRDWRLVCTPGFHEESGIFYDGPRIRPVQTTTHLDRMLAEFYWKGDADKVNYVGMLLTAATVVHWVGKHPLAVFSSNIEGLGKTLLARIIGLLIDGSCATVSYTPDESEFERQLATCIGAGDLVVIPVELGVGGLIDLAHAALADEGGDVVVAEAGADGQGHGLFRMIWVSFYA